MWTYAVYDAGTFPSRRGILPFFLELFAVNQQLELGGGEIAVPPPEESARRGAPSTWHRNALLSQP
jgi:hypothetical protein